MTRPNGVEGTRLSLALRFLGGALEPLFSALTSTPRPVSNG
jgi:hypothetical protein